MRARLAEPGGADASWRELAAAAGVGLSTMTHYFGRRDDVLRALLEQDLADASAMLERLARPSDDFATSLADAADDLLLHLHQTGGDGLAIGLSNGLNRASIGPIVLSTLLEPVLAALEQRLAAHAGRGDMARVQPRHAALAFAAPLILAHLQQRHLGGNERRPLDLQTLAATHVTAFIRAYGRRIEPADSHVEF